jgi:hypothetical protein
MKLHKIDPSRRLAHPNSASKYLECDSGFEFIKACPDGLVFNADDQLCQESIR